MTFSLFCDIIAITNLTESCLVRSVRMAVQIIVSFAFEKCVFTCVAQVLQAG